MPWLVCGCTTFSSVFADRRATARTTTFVEPCSFQIKKNCVWVLLVLMQEKKKHTLRIHQSSLLTPPAVISRQAEQIANARRRAAEGSLAPYTIPLLANTQTRSSKNRVTWTLKFTLMALPVTLTPSTTIMKPQHFSPTLTSSPCLITLPIWLRPGSNSWVVHPGFH